MTAGGGDTHGGADGRTRNDDDSDTDDRPSLAASVRDAAERGDSEERLVERVRASYDRDVPRRRVRRLVEIERERIEREDTERVVTEHAPRYGDLDDVTPLTDAEFGRVVAHLLGERTGRGERVSDAGLAGSRADRAATLVGSAEGARDATVDGSHRNDEKVVDSESVDGTEIRWHRGEGTVLVRAIAAEPGRAVDAETVRRVYERGRDARETNRNAGPGDSGDTRGDGEHGDDSEDEREKKSGDGIESGGDEGRPPVDTAIVTVADVVPGAARLAVRSGVTIYDRADVRRWLGEARLGIEPFGSLIEGS